MSPWLTSVLDQTWCCQGQFELVVRQRLRSECTRRGRSQYTASMYIAKTAVNVACPLKTQRWGQLQLAHLIANQRLYAEIMPITLPEVASCALCEVSAGREVSAWALTHAGCPMLKQASTCSPKILHSRASIHQVSSAESGTGSPASQHNCSTALLSSEGRLAGCGCDSRSRFHPRTLAGALQGRIQLVGDGGEPGLVQGAEAAHGVRGGHQRSGVADGLYRDALHVVQNPVMMCTSCCHSMKLHSTMSGTRGCKAAQGPDNLLLCYGLHNTRHTGLHGAGEDVFPGGHGIE